MQQIFFVGSYTHPAMNGRGKGIYTCGLEPATGKMTLLDTFVTTNPAYLALDKSKQHLFALEESPLDMKPVVQSFRITPTYGLEPLSEQPIPGEIACHLELDADDRFLAVANYGTGDVILYELNDGHITKQLDVVQHEGSSVNEERQEGPHAHATVLSPDQQFLLVTDLGLDEVKSYQFKTGKLELHGTFKTRPGSGPRHLVFHPNGRHAFIVNELDSTVTLVRYKDGTLSETLTMSTLPENHEGEKWAAAIHVSPSGKNVYVSNRVHDSIAVFAFDEARESLELIQHIASGGHIPRDFSLDPTGKFLITAHQNSDDLFSFWVDETGRLRATGHRLELGSPVCVKML